MQSCTSVDHFYDVYDVAPIRPKSGSKEIQVEANCSGGVSTTFRYKTPENITSIPTDKESFPIQMSSDSIEVKPQY